LHFSSAGGGGVTIDIDALRARVRPCTDEPVGDGARPTEHAELERLLAAFDEALAEVKRLTEQDHDLRESTEIWIRLYQDGLSRVEALRDAIAGAVTECKACARYAQDSTSVPERTTTTCGQCLKALDALQSTAELGGSKR
jgi:hypothetical protein